MSWETEDRSDILSSVPKALTKSQRMGVFYHVLVQVTCKTQKMR